MSLAQDRPQKSALNLNPSFYLIEWHRKRFSQEENARLMTRLLSMAASVNAERLYQQVTPCRVEVCKCIHFGDLWSGAGTCVLHSKGGREAKNTHGAPSVWGPLNSGTLGCLTSKGMHFGKLESIESVDCTVNSRSQSRNMSCLRYD